MLDWFVEVIMGRVGDGAMQAEVIGGTWPELLVKTGMEEGLEMGFGSSGGHTACSLSTSPGG